VIKEFRDFISRGNILELAIAVVIGVAFNDVVNSIVEGLITPLIGMLGSRDFSDLDFTINDSTFEWGTVVNSIIQFLSIAAAVFFIFVKPMNHLKERQRRGEVTEEELPDDIVLLTEIRDLLRDQPQRSTGRLYE
jgi:large conductance mechanosensitive channel